RRREGLRGLAGPARWTPQPCGRRPPNGPWLQPKGFAAAPPHRAGRPLGLVNRPAHHRLSLPRESPTMANFSAADVKKLRDMTGAGMMACKKALTEADGDFDQAVEALRVKGAKDVGKRAERTAAQGTVVLKRESDSK